MKSAQVRPGIAAVFVLVCIAAGAYFYRQYELNQAMVEQQALAKARMASIIAQNEARAALMREKALAENTRPLADKAMKAAIPEAYPRPVSDWATIEKSIYKRLFSAGRFDVLVVPFQVQEYALDRPTRSFMTAQLALAVSAAQKSQVPDPYLVARALGEGARRVDSSEVYSFADAIGAKKIIWGYVGHNRNSQMSLTFRTQERDVNGLLNTQTPAVVKNFEHISFSDELPPIEIYQSLLPEILAGIGFDSSILSSPKKESRFDAVELPSSPLSLVHKIPESARDAQYFQLLAYLTPSASERTRERFVEKSLLALFNMAATSPDYRVIKARAFMLMGLRPAALHVLGEPKSIEEKELSAILNGNQPDVDLLSSKIKLGAKSVMAKLDANGLASAYGGADKNKSLAKATLIKSQGNIWPFLIARAFSDLDNWSQFDNIYLKQLLDQEFPIKDYTAEGIVRGAATIGDAEKLQTLADLSVIGHIRKLMEIDAAKWCCLSTIGQPSALDYLNLIEAIGEDDLMRRADFLTETQGAPERAIEYLNRIENVYKGHPRFSLARAKAQFRTAKAVDGAEKEVLLKSAYSNAFDAMFWEQGQTVTAANAFDFIPSIGRRDYGYFDNFYAGDYPYRAHYSNWENGGHPVNMIANAEAALRNSNSNLNSFYYLDWYFTELTRQDGKYEAVLKSLEGRFAGNPVLYKFLAKNSLMKGDVQLAEHYYRESIRAQPSSWQAYMDLGTLLLEQGQQEKAAKLLMNYPDFRRGSNANIVGISNAAFEAGSKFYWLGEFSMAAPFYRIASRKETGSGADITSQLRLKLIEGEYREALLGSLERARHYNDTYGYRDYLGMLHAMGASKEAWDAFSLLANQIDAPHIWEAVLVAHRKEGKSEAEVAAWAKQQVIGNIGNNSGHAAKHLLRAGVTDRIPTEALAKSLADIARPVWKNHAGSVVQPAVDGGAEYILGPRLDPEIVNDGMPRISSKKYDTSIRTPIKSNLVYFAESYRSIRAGDFASGSATLKEAATLYDMSQEELGYMLPYYALAAARYGDAAAVENYMANFRKREQGFDYLLAKAVISGIAGNLEESVRFLRSALYKRPFTEERPLQTEYQYAEICELLYEATGNLKYKVIALDWAKKNQKFQPWFAWSYSMEAVLTDSKTDRKRSIAMAYYLDPQSEKLKKIPQKEREEAVRAFSGKNPFLIKARSEAQVPI